MKKFFRTLLFIHFYILIKIIFLVKKPYIVLIVWWENKSIIKEKLKKHAILNWLKIRHNERPYNTRFGVLLTILDIPSAYSDYIKWIWVYFKSWISFFNNLISFPEYLFLEWWIDELYEADRFIKILKPQVIVFWSIAHVLNEDFARLDLIENEYNKLVDYLNRNVDNKLSKKWDIEDVISWIKNWYKYFWVLFSNSERINRLWKRLVKKINI